MFDEVNYPTDQKEEKHNAVADYILQGWSLTRLLLIYLILALQRQII